MPNTNQVWVSCLYFFIKPLLCFTFSRYLISLCSQRAANCWLKCQNMTFKAAIVQYVLGCCADIVFSGWYLPLFQRNLLLQSSVLSWGRRRPPYSVWSQWWQKWEFLLQQTTLSSNSVQMSVAVFGVGDEAFGQRWQCLLWRYAVSIGKQLREFRRVVNLLCLEDGGVTIPRNAGSYKSTRLNIPEHLILQLLVHLLGKNVKARFD